MATSNIDLVQQLYVAYYNRPADVAGLNFWVGALESGASIADISKSFNTAPEYTALFAGKTADAIVDTVYMNLFGRHAETGGLNFWGPKVASGAITTAGLVTEFLKGAVNPDGSKNADAIAFDNKVTVANAFTTEISIPGNEAERLGYDSANEATLANIKAFIGGVTADKATLDAALANVKAVAVATIPPAPTTSTTLTTGVDAIVGGAGNDVINAVVTGSSAVIGGLDSVDGAGGNDVLNIADSSVTAGNPFTLPAGFTVKNVETTNIITNGSLGTASASFDVSGFAGLTQANLTSADSTAGFIKAGNTTAVNFTGSTGNVTISGSSSSTVTVAAGAVAIAGSKLASATVNTPGRVIAAGVVTTVAADTVSNGVAVTVSDVSSGTSAKTLTSVTLNGLQSAASTLTAAGSNGDATLSGDALTSVTLVGNKGNTVIVDNKTADHTLNLTVTDTGTSTARTVVTDAVAKTIAVAAANTAATKTSYVTLTGETAATAVTASGAGKLNLDLTGAASAVSFDGSAATGDLTLSGLAAGVLSIKTGAGNDTFTTTATAKFAVDAGAGNDIVTLSSAVAAGSTINLGAGNDTLLVSTGSVAASTATNVTVIDGGAGIDNVSASLINAANAAQFKNFEGLDLSATANLDVELLTGSVIQTLSLNGHAGATTGIVSNVAAGVGLTVAGDNSAGTATIGVKGAAGGTADAFTITFAGADVAATPAVVAANVKAGQVVIDGVETLNVVSAGGANTWNSLNIADTGLQTLNITGSKNLDVTFTGTIGTNLGGGQGLKAIDGSAATGKLSIDFTGSTVVNDANVGLTVKGGSANDTITLTTNATVLAGAGDDTIVSSAAGGTFTGGAGKDNFDLHLTGVTGLTEATGVLKTTITDIAAGDMITLGTGAIGAGALGAKVALDGTVTNLDAALALASNNVVVGTVTWFQYGNNTFIVENTDGTAGIDATDIVVKLTGTVDLSLSTIAAHVVTIV